jgi:hypothetical protein
MCKNTNAEARLLAMERDWLHAKGKTRVGVVRGNSSQKVRKDGAIWY